MDDKKTIHEHSPDLSRKESDTGHVPDLKFMALLQKIFGNPQGVLYASALSFQRKINLLKKWRYERTLYILSHCRDHDYMNDKEMDGLIKSVKVAKSAAEAEKNTGTKIRIEKSDNS
jgi:hypothetical protein